MTKIELRLFIAMNVAIAILMAATVYRGWHAMKEARRYAKHVESIAGDLPDGWYPVHTFTITPISSSSCPPGSRWCWKILDDR
jgi:hypothetical protein